MVTLIELNRKELYFISIIKSGFVQINNLGLNNDEKEELFISLGKAFMGLLLILRIKLNKVDNEDEVKKIKRKIAITGVILDLLEKEKYKSATEKAEMLFKI